MAHWKHQPEPAWEKFEFNQAFDCRVQRYFVQGMIEAMRQFGAEHGFDVRFDATIPTGAPACHFTVWRGESEESSAWQDYTEQLNRKALELAREDPPSDEA